MDDLIDCVTRHIKYEGKQIKPHHTSKSLVNEDVILSIKVRDYYYKQLNKSSLSLNLRANLREAIKRNYYYNSVFSLISVAAKLPPSDLDPQQEFSSVRSMYLSETSEREVHNEIQSLDVNKSEITV